MKTTDDIAVLARRALGAEGGRQLLAILRPSAKLIVNTAVGGRSSATRGFAPYPYRYPALLKLLNNAPARGRSTEAKRLGFALVQLASRLNPNQFSFPRYPNAAPAAFAVLNRARTKGDCLTQLNLLALVAADGQPREDVVTSETGQSEEACPGDPTPQWLLGQFQSQIAARVRGPNEPSDAVHFGAHRRALATVGQSLRRFPRSADILSGAADAHLRFGLQLQATQPFTARYELRQATAYYRTAMRLRDTSAFEPGLARALVGLNESRQAVSLLRPTIVEIASPGPRLEVLALAQEAAKDFEAAQRTERQLAAVAADAYPMGYALFPIPGDHSYTDPHRQDLMGPVSLGTDRATPFTVDLQPQPGGVGAGPIVDVSFIPTYRADHGFTGSDPSCAEWGWRRDAVLAGNPTSALEDFPEVDFLHPFTSVRPDRANIDCGPMRPKDFRALIRLEADMQVDLGPRRMRRLTDKRQNMWRWAGELPQALKVIRGWATATPDDALAMLRLGEVTYLQERYNESAAAFGTAARRARDASPEDNPGVLEAMLGRGAALLAADRRSEGLALLRSVDEDAALALAIYDRESQARSRGRFAAVAYYARAVRADDELKHRELAAAAEDYAAAREMLPILLEPNVPVDARIRPESLYNNEAVAQLRRGKVNAARATIDLALQRDPMSPVFLMTSGFIASREERRRTAIEHNAAALVSDPGAFPAANDLGVHLAHEGQLNEAETAFRKAIGARPEYALGWFNLGVLYSRMGPGHLLASQGSLARAIDLNAEFADRRRELTIDAGVYRTRLNLSEPLPARWSFADLERRQPTVPVGLLGVFVLGLGLARAASSGTKRSIAEVWLEPVSDRLSRLPLIGRVRRPIWAVAVSLAVLSVPMVSHQDIGLTAVLAFVLGMGAAMLIGLRSRAVAARRADTVAPQESWPAGMLVGIVTAPFGVAWAPLPVTARRDAPQSVYSAAPLTLAALAAVLFIEAVAFPVPVVRAVAVASLTMAASVILPVPPLDGARFSARKLTLAAGLAGAGLLLTLGLS